MNKYSINIGLEIHLHLLTESKAFCPCSTKFGNNPNSQTCPVCLGMPGVLPVLNERAFKHAVKCALALNCAMADYIFFDRKNYYYPDLPKNYQISQYATPIGRNGYIEIPGKKILINRIHMEEDAGKLIHSEDGKSSFVDYNRSGIPLLEIVTEPDINSPGEAYIFLQELKTTILYLGISDCNMEEGSLRCDCNISLKESKALSLGTKIELKNMNTFKGIKQALEYEVQRQEMLLENGKGICHETRLWDQNKQITTVMRTKEEVHDYRYFPDPDLVCYDISSELVANLKKELPELPFEKKARFKEMYRLNDYDIDVLTKEKFLSDYFEQVFSDYKNPKQISNFLTSDIIGTANELGIALNEIKLSAQSCSKILNMVESGKISIKIAKESLKDLLVKSQDPEEYIEKKGLIQINTKKDLEDLVLLAIKENPHAVSDYRNGKNNALKFLVGKIMMLTKGKANPSLVNTILKEKLNLKEEER